MQRSRLVSVRRGPVRAVRTSRPRAGIGFRKRERTQRRGADEAEDGRVGANAEHEQRDRSSRKARTLSEATYPVLDVLTE